MKAFWTVLLALALASGGCRGDDSTPTAPTDPPKTDTFTGTVQVNGKAIHNFNVEKSGQVSATLTGASPPASIVMGLGIGTPGENACGLLHGASVNTAAGSTAQLTGVVSPGTLCVTVFDIGNQTAPVTYTVSVVHP
jgi:hypothetical protein